MLAALFGVLGVGSVFRYLSLRQASVEERKLRLASLVTWWVLLIAVSAAALAGKYGIALFLFTASLLSIQEFNRVLGRKNIGLAAEVVQYGAVILLFALGTAEVWVGIWVAAPIACVIGIGAARSLGGNTENYLKITAGLFWAFFLFSYCPAFALRTVIESEKAPPAGMVGWFIFVTILTELNDICQALVGRRWGRTKITPKVSPNKSLEGLIGGIIGSAVFGIALAPTLTTFFQDRSIAVGMAISAATGVIVSLAGFLGDINVSSIKRDAGVKDIGSFVPGQGGALDRMNSFSYVAPVFYFWVIWVLKA